MKFRIGGSCSVVFLLFCWFVSCGSQAFEVDAEIEVTKRGNTTEGNLNAKRIISNIEALNSIINSASSLYTSYSSNGSFDSPLVRSNLESVNQALSVVKKALSEADPSVAERDGTAGILAVGAGAVIGPPILQAIKSIVATVFEFFDNMYFVATGQALSRGEIPDQLWNELFQYIIERLN